MAESDGILSSIWGAVDDACATAISAVAERAKALAVFHGALGNDAKAEFSNIQREDRSVGRKRMSLPHKVRSADRLAMSLENPKHGDNAWYQRKAPVLLRVGPKFSTQTFWQRNEYRGLS